jgi:2-polyprenyl-3-methyl-5-hydroxy-6-metoxy-1,4-benzoquinol methylase
MITGSGTVITVNEHRAVNRAFWDEVAPHHAASNFYAVERFVASPDSLGAIETAELGPVAGLEICHLQCHIGLDTLSLARRGATVTGVDFSAESLRIARELSVRTKIEAEFVEADVLEAAEILGRNFDVVFTSRGVLMWLDDLDRWARSCVNLLRPGGVLYLLDIHPLAMALRPTPTGCELTSSYFGGGEPSIKSEDRSYAVQNVGLTNQETHEWIHPVGEVVTALVGAGMLIDFLQEHPADDSGLPALFSVRGHVPGRS